VLVETPTYLGALQAFSLYGPDFVSVPSDDDGLIPEALDATMTADARLLYTQPNFQNPTARRMPLARREAIAALARQGNFPVIEDDPYSALDYRGEPLPTMLSMAPDHIIYFGTFSKVLAPGLRVGYVIAPEPLHFKLVQAKQATDLHTPILTQRIVYEAIQNNFLDSHVPTVRALYKQQCTAMLDALEKCMPEGVKWNAPQGGMFVWLTLPTYIDTMKLLSASIERKVAFVPGAPFYANEAHHNTMRLCFSTVSAERILEGVGILATLIKDWPTHSNGAH